MTSPAPAVAVRQLSKRYRVWSRPADRLLEALTGRSRHRDKHALAGIDFTVPAGESLGIIGENGAGKSTLLKILAGVTQPTSGEVVTAGRVASILELGTGFHPDLSGRQNVSLNAALLGLSAAEVTNSLPTIEAFAELGAAFDDPVKTYSTGMVMRLAFAIATQVRPRILIVDEALSVGDGYFQKKCIDHLLEFVGAGNTLLFCSHAMYYVSAFCQRALWLREGRVAAFGPAREVVAEYEAYLVSRSAEPTAEPTISTSDTGGPARLTEVAVLDPGGRPHRGTTPLIVRHGAPFEIEVAWESDDHAREFHLGFGFNRADELEVFACTSHRDGLPAWTGARHYRVRLTIPELPLVKGEFTLYTFLSDGAALHVYDQQIVRRCFAVESEAYAFGLVDIAHSWKTTAGPL